MGFSRLVGSALVGWWAALVVSGAALVGWKSTIVVSVAALGVWGSTLVVWRRMLVFHYIIAGS
jgi:hypothetical protein